MKDMKMFIKNYIAHRGLYTNDIPENSLEAFLNATNNGYDIEFDLQLSKDNKIVVFHDDSLLRMCGVKKRIDALTYTELKQFKLNNTSATIPLFTDVLDALPKSTNLMIELKTGSKNRRLVALFLDTIKRYNFNYIVQSFDPRLVHMIKKNAPTIARGYITKNNHLNCKIISFFIKLLPIHTWIKPDYYVYKITDLPNKRMDKMNKKGVLVFSYTATSKEELESIRDRYDNAVFEGFRP